MARSLFLVIVPIAAVFMTLIHGTTSFVPSFHNVPPTHHGRLCPLNMAPRYDPSTKRWEPTKPEEESSAGYPPTGSLLRQGPLPFIRRVTDPDSYEQGVLKMMANELMDRNEAQGNMDAYIRNPNDWALQKMEEKKGAPKFDYASPPETDQLILTGIWSSILLVIVSRILYVGFVGCDSFCQATHF